jgi:hypothetical protein
MLKSAQVSVLLLDITHYPHGGEVRSRMEVHNIVLNLSTSQSLTRH